MKNSNILKLFHSVLHNCSGHGPKTLTFYLLFMKWSWKKFSTSFLDLFCMVPNFKLSIMHRLGKKLIKFLCVISRTHLYGNKPMFRCKTTLKILKRGWKRSTADSLNINFPIFLQYPQTIWNNPKRLEFQAWEDVTRVRTYIHFWSHIELW